MDKLNSKKMFFTSKSLTILFVVYSKDRLLKNKDKFESLFRVFNGFGAREIIIINNGGQKICELLNTLYTFPSNVRFFNGSNKNAEFSGWAEAIHMMKKEAQVDKRSTLVLFNDTVFSHYDLDVGCLAKFLLTLPVLASREMPAISGTLHDSIGEKNCEVLDLPLPSFIRTAMFALNFDAMNLFLQQSELVFSRVEGLSFENKNSFEVLSGFYNEAGVYHVGSWLFVNGWYNSKPYSDFNKNLLKVKLSSILCEHSISAKTVLSGGALIDFQRQWCGYSNLSLIKRFSLKQIVTLIKFRLVNLF